MSPFARMVLQQSNHIRLLGGRTPADDDSRTLDCQVHELVFVVLQDEGETLAQHDQRTVALAAEVVQFLVRLHPVSHVTNHVQVLSGRHQSGALGDATRSLQFVASQHPDLQQQDILYSFLL